MSRFYGTIEGSAKTRASRRGSKASGIVGHTHGWGIGARVECFVGLDGNDRVTVTITRGANGHGTERPLGTYRLSAGYRNIRRTKD